MKEEIDDPEGDFKRHLRILQDISKEINLLLTFIEDEIQIFHWDKSNLITHKEKDFKTSHNFNLGLLTF